MLKNKLLQKIILVFFSVIFSIYLIEGIITVIDSRIFIENLRIKRIRQAEKLGISFDKRSLSTVVNDLRSQGIDAYPVLPPFYLVKYNRERNLLPLGTISHKVIVMHNETGTFETFVSDEHGFHNPQGSWDEKKTDILIVGDSFAMGANVRDGADIRSQLARYGKKVMTLGMNGNGPLLTLAGLCEYGKYLKPYNVLWIHYELNDLEDLANNQESPQLKRYLDANFSQNLLNRQNEIDQKYLQFYRQLWKQKNTPLVKLKRILFNFITLKDFRKQLEFLSDPKKSQLPLFETVLQKAKNVTTSWGGKLYFVYLPDYFRYFYQKNDQYALRSQVIEIVTKLDIPIIDFHQTLKQQKDPLNFFPFRVHGHYTEAGYNLLASTIISDLHKKLAVQHRGN